MAFIESEAFAYGGAGTESPLRNIADSAINKQNSDFSLNQADNLDECLLMNGIPLGPMNIDELLSSFCDDEDANQFSSEPNAQTHHQYISINSNQTIENQLVLARQSSGSAHQDFDKKTVEEVVYDIENPVNNNTTTIDLAPPERQHSCDEVTLEDLKVGTMEKAVQTAVPLPLPLPPPPPTYPYQMTTQPPPSQSNINTPQQITMPLVPVQSNIGNPQQKMMRQASTQRNICNPRQMPPALVRRNVGNPQQMMISPAPLQSNINDPEQKIMTPAPIQSNIGNPQQMMMTPVMIQSKIGNPQQTMMPATSIQSNINNSSGNPVYGMRNMNMNMNMGMHMNGMAIGYAVSQSNMGINMVVGSNSYMTYPIHNSPPTAIAADNNVADNNVEMDNIVPTERSSNNYRKRLIDIPVDVAEERKQLRMIKNREAAVRSRLRKQAYIKELEYEVQYLEEENKKLKETVKELEEKRTQEIMKRSQKTTAEKKAEKWKTIRRTSSF